MIVGIQPISAADNILASDSSLKELDDKAAVLLTSLSFAIVPEAFSATLSHKPDFDCTFSDNISYILNELIFDFERLYALSRRLRDNELSFNLFQKEWCELADSKLVINATKLPQGKTSLAKINETLRSIRCQDLNPEISWAVPNSISKQVMAAEIETITRQAEQVSSCFCETWRSIACDGEDDSSSAFRLDASENLTSIVTNELRKKNGPDSKGLTFIYIIMNKKPPILTSFKCGIFGILDRSQTPTSWIFKQDEGHRDELKQIFAATEDLDSQYLTATTALGISFETIIQ